MILTGLARTSFAQCTSPSGVLGTRDYFTGTNEYKYCNGTDWIQFSSVTDLAACTATAQWEWDTAEAAYKYCNGTVEKMPGCLWNASGGGGGSTTCPDGNTPDNYVVTTTLNNPSPNTNDQFGLTVAIDGTTAIIGAHFDDPGAVDGAGTAYVFDTTDGSLITTLNNPSPNTNDYFGNSVAISGNYAVVGAYRDEDDGGAGVNSAGRAYVFNATTGALITALNNPSPNDSDYFGFRVAIDGTTAVIAAYYDESDGTTGIAEAGRAYVFDATDGSLITALNNPSPNTNDYFGYSVAISGNYAVVSAYADESDGGTGVNGAGRAYVFDATTGALITALNNPSPNDSDQFGISVAISGTTVVVGAWKDESDGTTGTLDAGRAYVFDATTGALITALNNPSPNDSDYFGHSVTISGTTAIVGAYQDEADGDTSISAAGRAYAFDTTDGSLIATLNNPDPTVNDYFSEKSIAISGTTVVIGAWGDDPGGVGEAGTAYVFDTVCACEVDTTSDGAVTEGPVLNNPAPTASDQFGTGTAVDGTIAVVGADFDDPGGVSAAGTAYVFDTTDGSLISTLNNPDPTTNDHFGFRVAVSGTTAVIGAHYDDPGGVSDAGTAYVFDTTDGSLISTLNNPDPTTSDNFGIGVAISGTTAVVGANFDDPGAVDGAGTAYVFDVSTDPGTLIATLNNPTPTTGDEFGFSVAISGNTAVVGAWKDESDGTTGTADAGRAYVFDATDGSLIATLNNPNPTASDYFGKSVAVRGNIAVVSAHFDDPGGVSNAGRAYVFDTTDGSLVSTLNNPDPAIDDKFGWSVALSGTIAVISCDWDDPGGVSAAGTGYAFDTTDGSLIATLTNPSPNTQDYFSRGLSISGNTVVVGALGDDPGGVSFVGTAYVFELPTYGDFSGTLTETAINHPDPAASDNFGYSVSISGNKAIIGAPYKSVSYKGSNSNAGEAYVIDITDQSLLYTLNNPTPIAAGDRFGTSVAISGNYAVAGTPYEDNNKGTVQIFDLTDGSLIADVPNPNGTSFGYFGISVAISGTYVVAGASQNVSRYGEAYVFDATDGSLIATLSNPGPTNTDDYFGTSVAISGTTAVVGAYDHDDVAYNGGMAYIFDATDGTLLRTLSSPNASTNYRFGISVAISGDLVVVGEYQYNDPGGSSASGIAYVFDATDGSLVSTLNNPSPNDNDIFGYRVAISGTTAIVGAHGDESDGGSGTLNAGRAYVFDATSGTLVATLNNPSPNDSDNFGNSVAISGSAAIIGTFQDESDGTTGIADAGRSYVFSTGECIPQATTAGGGGSGACYNEGSCTKTGAIDVINGKFTVCNGSVWEVFAQ